MVAHQLLSLLAKDKIDIALIQKLDTDESKIHLLDRNPLRVVGATSAEAVVVANLAKGVLALGHLCTSHIPKVKITAKAFH